MTIDPDEVKRGFSDVIEGSVYMCSHCKLYGRGRSPCASCGKLLCEQCTLPMFDGTSRHECLSRVERLARGDMPDDMPPCDECQVCCFVPTVDALQKPRATRCVNQCSKGCSIYESRPSECAGFYCLWKLGMTKCDRPDRSGVFWWVATGGGGNFLRCDIDFDVATEREISKAMVEVLRQAYALGNPVHVRDQKQEQCWALIFTRQGGVGLFMEEKERGREAELQAAAQALANRLYDFAV